MYHYIYQVYYIPFSMSNFIICLLKREADYSLYGDYGQSNYGTLNGKADVPVPIEIPPEAIDEVRGSTSVYHTSRR